MEPAFVTRQEDNSDEHFSDNQRYSISPMNLISQYIKVIWNKAYRGNPGASNRSAIGDRFNLPTQIIDYAATANKALIHQLIYSYANNFAKPLVDQWLVFEMEKLTNIGCFQIQVVQQEVRVNYHWYEELGGAPARFGYDKVGKKVNLTEEAFRLPTGLLGKGEYNGRYADERTGEWRYEKLTLNICLTDSLDVALFARGRFAFHYKQLANLW